MAKVRKISKADKDRAVKNILKVSNLETYSKVIIVKEKDNTEHTTLCNGYQIVRFNDGIYLDVAGVENLRIDFDVNKEYSENVLSDNGQFKDIKDKANEDITDIIPSLADMVEICKTTNKKSKFIKEHFGCKCYPLVFADSQGMQHQFNMDYVYWSLLSVCSSYDTEYQVFVENQNPIGNMIIKGDLGTAAVLCMRWFDNRDKECYPTERFKSYSKAYDDFEKVVTAISDDVYNRVSDTENPIEYNYEFGSFKDTMTIAYDKRVFKNTVEFFIKEYFDSEKALYNEDMEKLKDNQQTITDTLVKLYCDCYYKYKKGYQKIISGFAKLNKTPDFDTMLKEFFITTMYKDYHSVLESLTCAVSIGQSIKIYNKYYKGSAA